MDNKNGLIFGFLLDGEGGGKQLTWDEIEQWQPSDGLLWVHCDYSSTKSKSWLSKKSGLDRLTVAALTLDESRPRSVISNDGLLLFIRSVNSNPGQEPEDMVSLRMWLDKNRLITTRRRHLLSVQDVKAQLLHKQGPKNLVELLLTVIDRVNDRIGDVIDLLEENLDKLEQQVIEIESRSLRSQLADVRREAILLRRYLAPQREAYFRLYTEDTPLLGQSARLHLREVTDRLIRYIEDLDSARDRAAITQEELMSRISEQMDRRMYILSMAAIIFLPLTFITGMLGINVGGIPGSQDKHAFWWVALAMGILTGLMLFYFRKRKWL